MQQWVQMTTCPDIFQGAEPAAGGPPTGVGAPTSSSSGAGLAADEEVKFKPKPPMVPDEATVTGAHVPEAHNAPAGVDIGVKVGADEVCAL